MSGVYAYSPYGEAATLGPDGANDLQYGGLRNDGAGLYHAMYRYYDPVLKQWISEDPIGMTGGPNLRAYVRGNSISRSDPLGLMGFGGGGSAGGNKSGSASRARPTYPCDQDCRACKEKWLANTYGDFFGSAADLSSVFGYVSGTRFEKQVLKSLEVTAEKVATGAVVEYFVGRELLYLGAGVAAAFFADATLAAGSGFVAFGTVADIMASSHCGCDVLQ